MSHAPERKEKDCLNCGATIYGRYCHKCGQENVVPKETFWSMFFHFFYDITHFDSKFFETVKDLIFRPGFLSKEYIKGRRNSYLHPVRMYVFTSAFFFLLFYSFFKPKATINDNFNVPIKGEQRMQLIEELQQKLKDQPGSQLLQKKLEKLKDTTRPLTLRELNPLSDSSDIITINGNKYKSEEEYDSLQKLLPASKRDGWFLRRVIKKAIDINERFHENPSEALNKLGESVLHRMPYMLFVSLPLFALILKLVYFRRKQFYFADHGIFTIHLYIFTFLLLLAVFSLGALQDVIHSNLIGFIIAILFIGLFFYLYKAMRNFYGQRRFKTFIKFLFVAFSSLIMMVILFALFLFFSAVTL